MPQSLVKDKETATETYAKFVVEPFESGYGHTLGNALRRVLLSSIEGSAITSIQIDGVQHEFQTIPNVVEDVVEIILNLKKVQFETHDHDTHTVSINVNKEGAITAADIQSTNTCKVLTPKQHIATLDKKMKFSAEFTVRKGRGFATGDENKYAEQAIGVIAIDSIFTPVIRVKYAVEATRVGQRTDYDKLVLEVWTDNRITPDDALKQSVAILGHHFDVFKGADEFEIDKSEKPVSQENTKLRQQLSMSVNEIELSVRAANCLNNANITTVGQLAQKSEVEMLKYRNFGKKSLNEIKDKLEELGLGLGMKLDPALVEEFAEKKQDEEVKEKE